MRTICGRKVFKGGWALSLFMGVGALAQTPRDFAVDLGATVSTNSPCITIAWSIRRQGNITAQKIYRRLKGETTWGSLADLATNQTSYADATAVPEVEYEYWMARTYTGIYPTTAMGYLSAGVNVPMVESRGKLLLVIDDTMVAPLAPEIDQLCRDLTGEGWLVQPITAVRTNTAAAVKEQILAAYEADPSNVKMVYLLGHVPVPYSGNSAPDGHSDHVGAWPCDGYYGELNGAWTDTSVNNTSASRSQNDNVPGDGKFDQYTFPNLLELIVGRVDLHGMTRAPSSGVTEAQLLRRYLRRAHDYRMKRGAYASIPRRSIVRDGFGYFSGENFAIAGWAWAFTCAGTRVDEPASGQWFSDSYAGGNTYLVGYGNGGGSYESASTVGYTADFGLKPSRAVFTSLFGSYFGDWDCDNDLLRAPLAGNATGDSLGLTCFWGGRPNRFMHPLGMGETSGYAMWVSQNSNLSGGAGYTPNNSWSSIHTGLMGDPALRLYAAEPPRNLSAVSSNGLVALSWSPSTATNLLGYHVYRSDTATGTYSRLTSALLADTAYADATVIAGQNYSYQVRVIVRESTPGGTFDNPSMGSFVTLAASASSTSTPRNPGSLSVVPGGAAAASLSWTDLSDNEASFRIERKVGTAGAFATLASVAANATNYVDPGGFASGTSYYYRVVAVNAAGDSTPSDSASFEAAAGFFDLPTTRTKVSKSAGSLSFSVNRFGGSNGVATLNFATADSSAWAGAHYTAASGTLTWADGESGTKTVTVPVINTSTSQPPRQFKVTMSSPSSGTSLSVNSSIAVLIEDATTTLPSPWSQTVVNGITDYSSAVMVSNVLYSLTVGGAGLASGSTYDAGQFVYQSRTGDGILTAYFPAGIPSDSSARYAVMVRASTANGAVMAATVTSSNTGYGTKLITRSSTGGSAAALPSTANTLVLNRWVRLTRTSNVFTSETSSDGVSWTSLGSVTLDALPDEALWGVFHYSSDWSITSLGNYQLATAQNIAIDDVPAPEVPTGVVATATSPTGVSVTWATVANAVGYQIERALEDGLFEVVADVSAGSGSSQTWTDETVDADSAYAYRVTAYNSNGTSLSSDVASVTTPQADTVVAVTTAGSGCADATVRLDLPDTPLGSATNLTVAGYDPDTWDVLTNAAKSYLRFDLSEAATFYKATLRLAFVGQERFDEAGFFNLYAYALADSSDAWDESAITWNNAPQNDLTGVGFTGTRTYLAYTNFYSVPAAGESFAFALSAANLKSALASNSVVTLGLAQYSGGGIMHWASREHPTFAAPVLELSTPSVLPPRPGFLAATVRSGWTVTLTWTDGSSDETGFELERRLAGGTFALLQSPTSNAVGTVDSTTQPGYTYEYRIRAVSAAGNSSWSPTASVTTPDVFHAVGTLWDGGGTDTRMSTAANWDTDVTPAFDGTRYLNFASGGSVATVDVPVALLGLSLHRGADFALAAGDGSLTVGSGGMRALAPEGTERTYEVAAPVVLGADQTWGVTNATGGSTLLEVSGAVTDGGLGFGIAKAGDGLLVLSGESGYGGTTTVAAGGGLRALGAYALGSTNGATVVTSNGWLEVGGGVSLEEPVRAGDAGALGAVRSTDGTNVLCGRLTQVAPTRVRALAGSRVTLAGGVSGNYDLVLAPDAGGEVAVSNAPLSLSSSSSRKVLVTGEGTVGFGGSGHVFGTLEVGGGSVRMEAAGALPSSSIVALGDALDAGGTVDLNGFDQTVAQLKRGISSPGARWVTASRAATLTVSGSTSTAYDGSFAGALSLTKSGSSTLTFTGTNNTFSGVTTVTAGTLDVGVSASLGNCWGVVVSGGTLRLRNSDSICSNAVVRISDGGKMRIDSGIETVGVLYLGGVRQSPGTYGSTASAADVKDNTYFDSLGAGVISVASYAAGTVWDAGGGDDTLFDMPRNWDADWPPNGNGTETIRIGTGGSLATLNVSMAFRGLVFNRDADFTVAAGGGVLTLGTNGLCAVATSAVARVYTVAAPVVLAAGQSWGVTNAGEGVVSLEVPGPVSDGGGAFGLTKSGDGLLTLAGSNSYGGVTLVAGGGAIRVVSDCALGSTNGATTVASNAWIEVGGGVSVAEPLTVGDASTLGALRSTDGTNVWSGRVTQTAPTRVRALAGSRVTLAGGVSGSYDLVLSPDAGGEVAVSNAALSLSSSRKVLVTGSGTVGLGGSGHVFGTLEVGGGSVRMAAAGALPSSSILALGDALDAGGTVDLNGFGQTVAQLKRGTSSSGARRVTASRAATLTVSGSTSTAYDGTLDGALGLAKAGSSTLTLSGTNVSYTGATVVGGGTLLLSGSGGLQGCLSVTVSAGTLSVQTTTNGLPDAAVLRIADGAKVYVKAGVVETVGSLYIAGKRARRGTWGASAATADFVDTSHFSGTGAILVLQGAENVLMIR